ncbi:MAG: hypothetical protein A2Y14_05530 [Verrucomicrobia bacterium GWF2_51_19]|nr:MAG: hypothetical protein A2Y14_05530 [Verrucomicrobia bacterium GWF2_51_19]HCJ11635.1 fluoride efflux transporter CrcB [Opitutae bacterium]
MLVLSVALGGALGALARLGLMQGLQSLFGGTFPYATFVINITGSFALGFLLEIFTWTWNPSADTKAFLVTGFLGAFTTFSTFSMDIVFLLQKRAMLEAALYVAGSVFFSLIGFIAGMKCV